MTGPRIDVDCNVLYVDTIQSSSIHGAYDSATAAAVEDDVDGNTAIGFAACIVWLKIGVRLVTSSLIELRS